MADNFDPTKDLTPVENFDPATDLTPAEEPESLAHQVGSSIVAGTRSLGNQASLGVAPYVSAGLDTAFGAIHNLIHGKSEQVPNDYLDNLAAVKAENDENSANHPIANVIGSVAGAAVPAVLTGGESLAGIAARNAATGAVQGAANSKKLSDVPANALEGATISALTSGAAVKGTQFVKDKLLNRGAELADTFKEKGFLPQAEIDAKNATFDANGNVEDPTSNQLSLEDVMRLATKDQLPDILKSAKTGAINTVKAAAAPIATGAFMTGGATLPAALTALGGTAAAGAVGGLATGGYKALNRLGAHAALETYLNPEASSLTGDVAAPAFSQIMNYIDQKRQEGMPDEAIDHVLNQTSQDYRNMKQK